MLGAFSQLSLIQDCSRPKIKCFLPQTDAEAGKKFIFPQWTFSHAITLFQERCKIPKATTSKKEKNIDYLIAKAVFNYPPH